MRATENGIILTKQEAAALIGFSHPDKRRPHVNGAQFIVDDTHVRAYASDGHRAVEAVFEHGPDAEPPEKGQWFVSRELLDSGRKLVENKQELLIETAGGIHSRIAVLEDGAERRAAEIVDAISTQTLLPLEAVQRVVKLPTSERPTRCLSISAGYLDAIGLIARASDAAAVDLWIPKTRSEALVFQLLSPLSTWSGSLASCGYDEDGVARAAGDYLDKELGGGLEDEDPNVP